MAAGIDREALRALVRQALRESLPATGDAATAAGEGLVGALRTALARGTPASVTVAVGSGSDLDRFAKGIIDACGDDEIKAAILAGDVRFELAQSAPPASAPAARTTAKTLPEANKAGAYEMASGLLNEVKVVEISRTHSRIMVGKDVVLTPLARDKAREIRIELVRQKP
ncbi:MAG: hypothetical protein GY798_06575 [Hyphomicrobiales bacterium]|nr:hypothetical protein [Hyphomicrobiales bacterium]